MIKSNEKEKIKIALKKTSGMVKKIETMVEEDVYCVNIAQQVSATIGLLKNINNILLKNHLLCCGTKKLHSHNPKEVEQFVDELIKARNATSK